MLKPRCWVKLVPKCSCKVQIRFSSNEKFTDTSNNFIEAHAAAKEYGLRPYDLARLPGVTIRSPYKNRQYIITWNEDLVKKKALERFKSQDAIDRVTRRKNEIYANFLEVQQKVHKNHDSEADIMLDEVIKEYRIYKNALFEEMKQNKAGKKEVSSEYQNIPDFTSYTRIRVQEDINKGSLRVTKIAAFCNFCIAGWKLVIACSSGSATMFGEFYHSLGDTAMQLSLVGSHYMATKQQTTQFPYGFKQLPQIASLCSGVGIFAFGAISSIQNGVRVLNGPADLPTITSGLSLSNPYIVLGVSLVLETLSLLVAMREVQKQAALNNRNFLEQLRSSTDPTTSVVFYEDTAAVAGIIIAGASLKLMEISGSHLMDGIGSIGIGICLSTISAILIKQSSMALIGKSIPQEEIEMIRDDLENDGVIRGVYDMKVTYVSPKQYRLKAEIDFDGRKVGKRYFDTLDRNKRYTLYEELKKAGESEKSSREFLLTQNEEVVDQLGWEIDRIETNLKKKYPNLRHIDLELN